ncbi:hypothetical protein [Nocardia pseudovaccinii]|uniref:hypothetical protein n=1 Tax=Nocardia pseudovaccinii TaxID=189540 RepID=UPI000AF98A37|nr:hypothetical protein [Nocardia pseudovaccinii]
MTDRDRTESVLSGGRYLRRRIANPVRQAQYDEEVDKLIEVTQGVMLDKGRTELPTVAEIVRAAGVTNQDQLTAKDIDGRARHIDMSVISSKTMQPGGHPCRDRANLRRRWAPPRYIGNLD